MTEGVRLRQELSETQKEIESRGAELASLNEVVDGTTLIKKEVRKLLSSVSKVRGYRLAKDALTRQREAKWSC